MPPRLQLDPQLDLQRDRTLDQTADRAGRDPQVRPPVGSQARSRAASRFATPLAMAAMLLVLGACAGSVEDRLAEVRALQDAGQFSESVKPLRDLLAKHPDQPEANYLLGVALVQTGQLSQAVWPLEKAVDDPGQEMTAGLLLASTFLGLQANEDAVRVATKVLEKDPDRIAALKVRAQALIGANQREEALKDTTRLRKLAPDDYMSALMHATVLAELGRLDEADKAHEELEQIGERTGDPSLAVKGCLARATFYRDNMKDMDRAEKHYRECIDKAPADPLALRLVSQFYEDRHEPDQALALWEHALKEAPENLQIRAGLAARYEALGESDKARDLFKQGVELLGSAEAWLQLADFERRSQHPDKALEAVDQAINASPTANQQAMFLKADLLIDLNRLDEADKVAASFDEPSFRDLIRGRILLARGDPKAALDTFESGLKRWPNNPGGRFLAGLAAIQVGDFARAESEFREAVRVDAGATDAAYALANLYLSQGKYQAAADYGREFLAHRGGSRPEGYETVIRASIAIKKYDSARTGADLLEKAGFPDHAAQARAEIALASDGPDAAMAVVKKSSLDLGSPERETLLRAIAERMTADGRTEDALKVVDGAIAKHPDSAPLHELRGTLLVRLDRTAEAQTAFDKALELDPKYGRAKAGLASLALKAGDREKAIALFDEAAKDAPRQSDIAYAAAQLVLASGDRAGAQQRLEEIVKRDPGSAGARNDLAWLLAEQNQDLDRALVLAEEARRLSPTPEVVDTLGFVMLQRGQLDQAAELFSQALKDRPDSPSIRYHYGLVLSRQGEREKATEALRQALEAGPFPEAEAAKSELARLEQK